VLRRPHLLERMGRRAGELVDGRGSERVAVALLRDLLTLRRAEAGDAEMAWRWRNDETTRRNSLDPSPVSLNSHITWWTGALADRQRDLLIAQIGQLPVGVLRLDQSNEGAVVSIYLDPQLTGLGLGRYVLQAGQRWIVQHRAASGCLIAQILPANRASIAIFEATGFAHRDGRWVWKVPAGATDT
jgi:RimJ/RimL family protein N-acetyltransferase